MFFWGKSSIDWKSSVMGSKPKHLFSNSLLKSACGSSSWLRASCGNRTLGGLGPGKLERFDQTWSKIGSKQIGPTLVNQQIIV